MTSSNHRAINNVVSPFSLHLSTFLYDRYFLLPCFRLFLICGEFRLFSCLLRLHQQGGYVGLIDLLGLFSTQKKEEETCLAYSKSADCIRDKRRRSVQVAFLSILAFCTRLLAHWPSQQNLLWTSELPACVVCQCMNWRRCRFLLQETPKKVKRPDLNTVQNWRRARAVRNVKIYDKINAVHSSMIRSNGPCSNSRCSCTSEFSFSTPWMDDAGQLLLRTAH